MDPHEEKKRGHHAAQLPGHMVDPTFPLVAPFAYFLVSMHGIDLQLTIYINPCGVAKGRWRNTKYRKQICRSRG
jgi:hypothetical protein